MRVGEEMDRRAIMVSGKGKRRIYSSKYILQVLSIVLNVVEEKSEQSKIIELEKFLENQQLEIERYNEDLVRKLADP